MLGGGGYTIRNVARCWTYETAVALDSTIPNGDTLWLLFCSIVMFCSFDGEHPLTSFVTSELPYNDYFEYFGPDFKLHISPSNMTNQNTNDYLEKIKWVEWLATHAPFNSHFSQCISFQSSFTKNACFYILFYQRYSSKMIQITPLPNVMYSFRQKQLIIKAIGIVISFCSCCINKLIWVWYAYLNLYHLTSITCLQVVHWGDGLIFKKNLSLQTAVVWESADVASRPRGSDAGDPGGCCSGRQWRWGGRPGQTHLQWVPALFSNITDCQSSQVLFCPSEFRSEFS